MAVLNIRNIENLAMYLAGAITPAGHVAYAENMIKEYQQSGEPIPVWLLNERKEAKKRRPLPDHYVPREKAEILARSLSIQGAVAPLALSDEDIDKLLAIGKNYSDFRHALAAWAQGRGVIPEVNIEAKGSDDNKNGG